MPRHTFLEGLQEHLGRGGAPIRVAVRSWEATSDRRLRRSYHFDDHHDMCSFVAHILNLQDEIQHYAKMSIDFPDIEVELFTHDVMDVTETDKQLAGAMDGMYDEISLGGMDVAGPVQDLL